MLGKFAPPPHTITNPFNAAFKKSLDQHRRRFQTGRETGSSRVPASKSGPRFLRAAIRARRDSRDKARQGRTCLTHFGSNPDRGFDSDWLKLTRFGSNWRKIKAPPPPAGPLFVRVCAYKSGSISSSSSYSLLFRKSSKYSRFMISEGLKFSSSS